MSSRTFFFFYNNSRPFRFQSRGSEHHFYFYFSLTCVFFLPFLLLTFISYRF